MLYYRSGLHTLFLERATKEIISILFLNFNSKKITKYGQFEKTRLGKSLAVIFAITLIFEGAVFLPLLFAKL
jgi:hypothetical protein